MARLLLSFLMAVLATDNFNRADVNPLAGVWTTGFGENAFQIVSNVATPSTLTANDCGADYTGIVWPADQYSKAKLSCVGTTAGDAGAGLKVRSSSSARTYYRLVADHGATLNVSLQKFIAASFTLLPGWEVTQAWTDGDTWELRVRGSLLQVFLNGVQVGPDTTDTAIVSGSPGIAYSTLSTSASIDDWEGGDLLVPAAPLLGNLRVGPNRGGIVA